MAGVHRQRKFGGLLDGGLRYGLGNHMEDVYIPTNTLDALNVMIADNFIYLPLLSGVIYAVWSLIIWKPLKSVWYISLGAPAIGALILEFVELISSGNLVDFFYFFSPAALVFLPGYFIPSALFIINAIRFSRTDVMSMSSYVVGALLVFTYAWTWFFHAALRYG